MLQLEVIVPHSLQLQVIAPHPLHPHEEQYCNTGNNDMPSCVSALTKAVIGFSL